MAILNVRNKQGVNKKVDESNVQLAEKDGFYPVVSNGQSEKLVRYSDLSRAAKDNYNLLGQAPQNVEQPNQGQSALMSQVNQGIKEIPEAAGSAYGMTVAGPLGSGVGGVVGKAASEFASGVESAIKNPQQFISDLGRLPTKEQVIDEVNKYLNTFSLNAAAPVVGGKIAKGVSKVAEPVAGAVSKVASKVSPITSNILNKAGSVIESATVKGGSALTGIPENNVETYIKNTKEINQIIAKNGGDMTQAADELRSNLQGSIRSTIMGLNDDIKKIVLGAKDASAPKDKIIEALDKVKESINPKLYPEAISEIEGLANKVNSLADESGNISAKDISDVKGFFQDFAKGSYLKGGQLFSTSSQAQSAAKQAGREARKIEIATMPETAQKNLELSKIHGLEKNINKNLITPERPDAALMAAGAGQNQRNVRNLQRLGDITGQDVLGQAEKLSAAKAFSNPNLMPVDTTGKSFARMAVGSAIGAAAAGPVGAPIGMMLSSPVTLKAAINAGQISKNVVSKLAGGAVNLTDDVLKKAIDYAKTPQGQIIIANAVKSMSEPKGQAKWADNGAKMLMQAGVSQDDIKNLSQDQLIRVSGLNPNSDAFKKVVSDFNKPTGNKYPMTLRKNGYIVTVQNDADFKEAVSKGWQK